MSGKKKAKPCEVGAPAWMVTYSDLVTLLLTFFVLLLSMANLDQLKFNAASESIKQAFGVVGTVEDSPLSPPKLIQINPVQGDLIHQVYKRIEKEVTRLKLDKDIKLVKDRGAVVLRVNDSVLFDAGNADLKPAALSLLSKIADLVRPLPFHLRTEGHTDDTPFGGGQLSNWDLSMIRAVNVVKYFAQNDLFPLDRISAAGYGSYKPVVPNDSPENRAMNRRVDFILESQGGYTEDLPYLIDVHDQFPF